MRDEEGKQPELLKERTKRFALRIVRLYSSLSKAVEAQVLGKQVLRSGMSVGAHYREASRSRSDAEFVSKLEGALQELEETAYWLDLLGDSGRGKKERLADLLEETNELTAILVSVVKKVKARHVKEHRS